MTDNIWAQLTNATPNTWETLVSPGTYTPLQFSLLGSSTGITTLISLNASETNYTINLPAANDTITLNGTAATLTNKTFDTAGAGNVFKIAGTQISATTGTGSVVLANAPTIAGAATFSGTINGLTLSPTTGTFSLTNAKTFAVANSLTLSGTDGSSLNIGAGGTLGSIAYHPASDFVATSTLAANSGTATLDSSGKLSAAQIPPSLVGAVQYQGTWNASTNTPTLVSSTGTKGWYYVVSTPGTTSIDGQSVWGAGDWIVFDGSKWDRISDQVTSTEITSALGFTPLNPANNLSEVTPATALSNLGGIGAATSNVLTNKTFDTGATGNIFRINGTQITANTGTGSNVLASSPSLTSPSFSTIVNTGTLTLPTSTDTLVGRATADTLTNKTFDTAGTGNVLKVAGTQISAITGSGSLVLATSPTLVNPTLGVATATSINGLTITSSTGALTLASGKTFSVTNSLTLAGTDGSTLNIGTGGTLGSNAFTSTAYAALSSPTFTGTVTSDTFAGTSNSVNAQTGTSYTLVSGDNGKVVTLSNASAITLTVPSGLPAGFSCTLVQLGAGQVTITASSTTLQNRNGLKLAGQYAQAGLFYIGTNTYSVGGDLST